MPAAAQCSSMALGLNGHCVRQYCMHCWSSFTSDWIERQRNTDNVAYDTYAQQHGEWLARSSGNPAPPVPMFAYLLPDKTTVQWTSCPLCVPLMAHRHLTDFELLNVALQRSNMTRDDCVEILRAGGGQPPATGQARG